MESSDPSNPSSQQPLLPSSSHIHSTSTSGPSRADEYHHDEPSTGAPLSPPGSVSGKRRGGNKRKKKHKHLHRKQSASSPADHIQFTRLENASLTPRDVRRSRAHRRAASSFSAGSTSPYGRASAPEAPHGGVHRKTIHIHDSSWEILFKTTYAASVVLVMIALTGKYLLLRRIGAAGSTLSLLFLALVWHHRYGVASKVYDYWLCAGFFVTVFGDEIVMTPPSTDAHMLSFLLFLVGHACFAFAFWTPSVPLDACPDAQTLANSKTYSYKAAAIPISPMMGILSFALAFSCLAIWYFSQESSETANDFPVVPAFWFQLFAGFSVWRALARVGYRSPSHVQARNEIKQRYHAEIHNREKNANEENTPQSGRQRSTARSGLVQSVVNSKEFRDDGIELFSSYASQETTESRNSQLCAVAGIILVIVAQMFLGITVFWDRSQDAEKLEQGSYWGTYMYIIFDWVGKLFLCYSIPCLVEPLGSLTDEFVTPAKNEELSLDVLIPLSGNGIDAVQISTCWYYLTSRGHNVHFALPEDFSGNSIFFNTDLFQGYGLTNIGGAGPLVGAMYEEMKLNNAVDKSFPLNDVRPERYHGIILCDGVLSLPSMSDSTQSEIRKLTKTFLETNKAVGLFGRWVPCIGCPDPKMGENRSPLYGRTVTMISRLIEMTLRAASIMSIRKRIVPADSSYSKKKSALRDYIGPIGKVINGPKSWLARGTPWDDSNAFCVDDQNLVTARWSGDTFLLSRFFTTIIEEVALSDNNFLT